ncbi:SHOCT domain-containing protein [Aeromicrobium yanjiei]|uniref:SHOCT domain-containing protein n=1 Tax=Aeromicrobium yanjiei TaxID=2662028 RepID=A0A5Q2MM87_9ACTN|nr:SHOCT domain-containing protein [Aeromicrobium yanjiei]QGG42232.1 hypothetical protein GEV26_13120 [Aeromicrobium yanjiei]
MSPARRAFAAIGATLAILVLGPVASAYGDTLQECIARGAERDGEPPTCTKVGDGWKASWPDDPVAGGGDSGIVVLMAIAALLGVAFFVWKVVTARSLAKQSGMDPDLATQMTLLTGSGLEATYLAANLRRPDAALSVPAPAPAVPAATRLADLKSLLEADLLTQAEYDERRAEIIDGL